MKEVFVNKHSIEVALQERGGKGCSVEVNPIVTQGTKIAEITVDDKKSEIYAPAVGSIASKNMWVGTQEQYDSIKEKDANTLYFITK